MSHSNLKCNVHRGQETSLSHHHKQSFQSLAYRNFWIAGYREQPVSWHQQIIHCFWNCPRIGEQYFVHESVALVKRTEKHQIDWNDLKTMVKSQKRNNQLYTHLREVNSSTIVASPVKMDTYKSVFNGLLSWIIQVGLVQWEWAPRHCPWRPKCHRSSLDGCVAWAVYV